MKQHPQKCQQVPQAPSRLLVAVVSSPRVFIWGPLILEVPLERTTCLLQEGLQVFCQERTGTQSIGLFHQKPTSALTCITPEPAVLFVVLTGVLRLQTGAKSGLKGEGM